MKIPITPALLFIFAGALVACSTNPLAYYPPQFTVSELMSETPATVAAPVTVQIYPNPKTALLSSQAGTGVYTESLDGLRVKIPSDQRQRANFALFIPLAMINTLGYNPSLEQAFLRIKLKKTTINTVAIKLSGPNITIEQIRKEFGNVLKITDVGMFSNEGQIVLPIRRFYRNETAPGWKLNEGDPGSLLVFILGGNVAKVDPHLQKNNDFPSGRQIALSPYYAATVGDWYSAYRHNNPGEEMVITKVEITFPYHDPRVKISNEQQILNTEQAKKHLDDLREQLRQYMLRTTSTSSSARARWVADRLKDSSSTQSHTASFKDGSFLLR